MIIRLTVAGADSVLDSAQMTHGSVAKVELRSVVAVYVVAWVSSLSPCLCLELCLSTLGADSLSMTRLAAGVKAFFHVDVPVSLLLKV